MSSSGRPKKKAKNCPIFGVPKKIKNDMLPTYHDLMKHFLFVRSQIKQTINGKDPSVRDISETVAADILKIWMKASLPTVSHERIIKMILIYHDKYRKLMKPMKERQCETLMVKVECFRNEAKTRLFDICTCKCENLALCSCVKDRKVPEIERNFLLDQRTLRLMSIGSVDRKTTEKLTKRARRRSALQQTSQLQRTRSHSRENKDSDSSTLSSSTSDTTFLLPSYYRKLSNNCTNDEQEPSTSTLSRDEVQMRLPLPAFAMACDRTGVSDRAAATIATAVLEDIGMVTCENNANVIDRSKVRRERRKKRSDIQTEKLSDQPQSIFFDGRKDKTIKQIKKGTKYYKMTETEEHITILEEPGSRFLGHTTPTSGNAKNIKDSIVKYLEETGIQTEQLVAVGCDGTAVNTGAKAGVIRQLEDHFGKPMQWLVCLLHTNELPLRHLIQYLDGDTKGPSSFSGPIGKNLEQCENMPLVSFRKIKVEVPDVDKKDLSTDQLFLLEMVRAIASGDCSEDLSRKNPGKLSHARWLTTANRILRLYVAIDKPCSRLKILVLYIMKVYAPTWFAIKRKPSCTQGSKHLWKLVKCSRFLNKNLRCQVIDPVIQNNAFFGHPENLLLAMITDERQRIRKLAVQKIKEARKKNANSIRQFTIPEINFDAEDYVDLIDWEQCTFTEPPITKQLSEMELERMAKSKNAMVMRFSKIPCHTQAVERCVKLVTQASAAVCGQLSRDGYIRSRQKSRQLMPSFDSKREFRTQH